MPYPLEFLRDGSIADLNFQRLAQDMNPPVPQARVFTSAAISMANGAVTVVTFDSESFDNGAVHSTTSNTSRLTAPITGVYLIGETHIWAASLVGERYADILANGGSVLSTQRYSTAASSGVSNFSQTTMYQLTAGQYVELRVYQNTGGALNLDSATFWMVRVGGYVNQGV
jgi:hypothetical protein